MSAADIIIGSESFAQRLLERAEADRERAHVVSKRCGKVCMCSGLLYSIAFIWGASPGLWLAIVAMIVAAVIQYRADHAVSDAWRLEDDARHELRRLEWCREWLATEATP